MVAACMRIFILTPLSNYSVVCAAQDSLLNVLEDTLPSMLWRWELREVRVLPHDQRQAVALGKKRSKAVQDALSALELLADVLQTCDLTADKVNARAQKAWDAHCKAITVRSRTGCVWFTILI